ncbi:MAG: hypothetical protein ACYTGC_10750, partial [Planctomycetota bacterium]
MRRPGLSSVVTYALLGGAVAGSLLLPDTLTVPTMWAAPQSAPTEVQLTGVVRDFKRAHPDFNTLPSGGTGHYAGSVAKELGPEGRPVLAEPVDQFTITNGQVIPGEAFAAEIKVLGAELASYPVTVRVRMGNDPIDPFGPYDDVAGTVNDGANPRSAVLPEASLYPPGTPIGILGRSWIKTGDDDDVSWTTKMEVSSFDGSANVYVLRNGDVVPSINAAGGQASVADLLVSYVDASTGLVT